MFTVVLMLNGAFRAPRASFCPTTKTTKRADIKAALRDHEEGDVILKKALHLMLACSAAITGSSAYAQVAAKQVGAPTTETSTDENSDIIVTGTRQTGIRASDSAAPIQILGEEALSHVGQPSLSQVLTQTTPSFNAQSYGFDTGNLTLSASLRGMNPNNTLVLIDGKRRHTTSNLQVLQSAFQGATAADLSLVPVPAIASVEILQDGAAALYGTDAIAGVVNIRLKDANHGGSATITAGQYYRGDGDTVASAVNLGLPLGGRGFVNVTAEARWHDYSFPGGPDSRLFTPDGQLRAGQPAEFASLPGAPNVNKSGGDARYRMWDAFVNAGYDLGGGVTAYATGSYADRHSSSRANYRLPTRIVASSVRGVAGTYGTPGAIVFSATGFSPRIEIEETDFALGGGLKGSFAGFAWDLNSTWGKNINNVFTRSSANRSLFIDTGATPRDFYDGSFTASQWTNTLDVSKPLEIGLPSPANLAFGVEYRQDRYSIAAGDAASRYKEGAQSYPGFQPGDAGRYRRSNAAAYVNVALSPMTPLKLDVAGRYEHYSDFGSTLVGRLTGRYDLSETFALRGTIATGFRAPTLAEEHYSATNVTPTSATVQLPANSRAATLLGLTALRPEKSRNYSVGFVARPSADWTLTTDFFRIDVRDRIIATGSIVGASGGVTRSQAVVDAITAYGSTIDPTVQTAAVSVFTNGTDARTQGFDVTLAHPSRFDFGRIDWTLAANYSRTTLDHIRTPPAQIAASRSTLLTPRAITTIEDSTPRFKITGGALLQAARWTVNLRETLYGPASRLNSPDATGSGASAYRERIGTTAITDLEIGYAAASNVEVSIGANNLFNKKPPTIPLVNGMLADGGVVYNSPYPFSAFGINGGYYYVRLGGRF